jgi:uncharacterized membrane protein YedE/YeeE
MTTFTPVAATIGGVLIGLGAVVLMAANGRIAGISGIAGSLCRHARRTIGAGGSPSSLASSSASWRRC